MLVVNPLVHLHLKFVNLLNHVLKLILILLLVHLQGFDAWANRVQSFVRSCSLILAFKEFNSLDKLFKALLEPIDLLSDLLLRHDGFLAGDFELVEALGNTLIHGWFLRFEKLALFSILLKILLNLIPSHSLLFLKSLLCIIDFHADCIEHARYLLFMRYHDLCMYILEKLLLVGRH